MRNTSRNAPALQSPIRCLVHWKARSHEHFPKRCRHFGERIPAENGKKALLAGWQARGMVAHYPALCGAHLFPIIYIYILIFMYTSRLRTYQISPIYNYIYIYNIFHSTRSSSVAKVITATWAQACAARRNATTAFECLKKVYPMHPCTARERQWPKHATTNRLCSRFRDSSSRVTLVVCELCAAQIILWFRKWWCHNDLCELFWILLVHERWINPMCVWNIPYEHLLQQSPQDPHIFQHCRKGIPHKPQLLHYSKCIHTVTYSRFHHWHLILSHSLTFKDHPAC